ncbi:hypothetical protein E1B28_001208 [Marasmius oreades]|uniref:Uncharacterized protein n=1 Tax=Marasmius oreades TaxID=181124 RepID=A0A9P7V396_9AGAR|nr:uncharacterized protein E1B28_001208 [Marasmius oreades]KAG7099352.1 hypothetical protein E1B28_001208 [Marasmius oreades]
MVDSETESESGEEYSFALPGEGPSTSQLSLTTLDVDQHTTVIQVIRNACMAELPTNVEGRAKVLEAAIKVVQFLDSMLESGNVLGELTSNFIPLVEPKFLSILFGHRKIFRRIATQQLLPMADNASMVVCWVDNLLAKLSEITSLMAGGLVRSTQSETTFLTRRREHDTLVAATQLPDDWSSVASVLDAPHSSPAARRLALRLLFAAFMVGPWLSGSDPWSDPENISTLDLLRILNHYISQSSSNAWTYVSEPDCTRERLTFAITLSLYAAADTEDRRRRNHSPLRPRTLASLLNYMHYIVSPPNIPTGENRTWLTSSFEPLDPPQTLLLRWRETVLWCWQTWKDSRTANSDSVIHMTAQWLFHCDTERILTGIGAIDSKRMLLNDPRACSAAITRLLHELVDVILSSPGLTSQDLRFYTLISKTTKTFLRLFRENFTDQGFQRPGETQEIFKYLASLFVLLPEKGGECSTATIKHRLLETSTLLDVAIIRHVLPSLCKDKRLAFIEKIDDLMFRTRKYLTSRTEELHSDEVVRVNLDFISFVWYNTGKGVLPRQAIAPFISALLEYLRPETGGFAFNSAMSCLSILGVHPSCDIKHHKTGLWRVCIQAPCSNLAIAASFAYSILHDNLGNVNDVLRSQAFNYLRGSLALTIRGDFIDKDEPVALSVSTLLCSALLRLLDAELPALTYMVLSPWTKTFCVNLKALLHSDCPNSSYRGILKRRLDSMGNRLLNLIEGRSKDDGSESSQNTHVECRLIMCETLDVPSLIFVPDE